MRYSLRELPWVPEVFLACGEAARKTSGTERCFLPGLFTVPVDLCAFFSSFNGLVVYGRDRLLFCFAVVQSLCAVRYYSDYRIILH